MAGRIVAFENRDHALAGALVGIRIMWRLRGNQVLVVEKRSAKRTHEKIVTQGEVAGDIPQPQIDRRVSVIAYQHGAYIAPGHKAIVAATVDLRLVFVEAVYWAVGYQAHRQWCDSVYRRLE